MLKQLRNAIARLFSPSETPQATISEPLDPSDRERLIAAEKSIARMQDDFLQLRLTWAETVDKLQAWASRQSTRDRRALRSQLNVEDEPEETAAAPATAEAMPSGQPTKAELRARLAALQRRTG